MPATRPTCVCGSVSYRAPYLGAWSGPFPTRAFGLASVVVADPSQRHSRNPLWRWAVLTAAERLTGWSYAMTSSGSVRSSSTPRTIPVPRPDGA